MTFKMPSGNEIPAIGLGTYLMKGDECAEAVRRGLEVGYRHLDTASIYENHEAVRTGMQKSGVRREEIYLTSKVWYDFLHYDDVLRECDLALKELGTDYLDLYLIHWPNKNVPMEETFRAIEKIQRDGKARDIGVSNFTIAHIKEAVSVSKAPIAMNQVEYHVHFNQEDLLAECQKHGIRITAYAPLGRGAVLADPVLATVAEKYGKTPAQVALRWMVQKGVVVIPKASSVEHLRANFDILGFELADEEMDAISTIRVHERLIDVPFGEFDRK